MTLKGMEEDNEIMKSMIMEMLAVIEGGDTKLDFEHSTFAFNLIESLSDFLGMKLLKIEQHIENQKIIKGISELTKNNILDAKFGKDRKLKICDIKNLYEGSKK